MRKQYLEGMIKRHPDGFGFFIPDEPEHPDVYIPRNSMKGVMTNDRVMIDVFPERGSQRFRGEIIRVVSRGTKTVVGTYHLLNPSTGVVRDDGKGWSEDLKVPVADSKGAQDGELVSVEILSYPDSPKGFRGRVVEVIGNALDPLTDIRRVILQAQIPHEFPKPVQNEARQFSETVSDADLKGRKDLRALSFITIDGATAKDFDDAIHVEVNNQGFMLYVAIADVSHYVRPMTAIDEEAYLRGTSVYFPNFVVPMLPEVLSNGLCSLNPHVPRLALVAQMQMDFTGEVLHSDFYEAVIESHARVTYGEAQEVIDGEDVEKLRHVKEDILRASDLAKILMAKRFKEGSLDLEIPETQIVLDSAGIPIDFIRSERLFAHRLIEEMMLAANVAVATFLSSREIPAIYRIHEPPNEDSIALLETYLEKFGGHVKISQGKLQKRLTRALQEFEGKPEAQVLNILTLRSMSQAKYSADNVGHFGLGFEFYTHFTSPIRRYPDLIVHRLLKSQVVAKSGYKLVSEDELRTAATMLSACEQRSVKAERQFQAIKKARFMQKFLGEEFDGIISSVTKFGVFVLLRQFEVDGLIRSENLSKEKLEFDEDSLILYGKRSGMQFAIGDILKVRVDAANPEAGQVDFGLASIPKREADEDEDRPGRRQRKSAKPDKAAARGRTSRRDRDEDRGRGRRDRGRETDRDSVEPVIEPSQRPSRRDREPSAFEIRTKSAKKSRTQFEESAEERPSKSRNERKSRKAQALDQMEDKVVEFLSEANSDSESRGEKFDPEKHLQKVLKKWKERNADTGFTQTSGIGRSIKSSSQARTQTKSSSRDRFDGNDGGDDRPSRAGKSSGEGFFKKFTKGSGGSKKSSSSRGKRK